MITPRELWEVFEDAYSCCPHGHYFEDDDPVDHINSTPIGKLKKSYEGVITYWLDPTTKGGHVLINSGYIAEVPEDILCMVKEYRAEVKRQERLLARKIFGGNRG